MNLLLRILTGICLVGITMIQGFSQSAQNNLIYETIINQRIGVFDLTPDNLFRLAAYTELKGQFSKEHNMVFLNFGGLGTLSFYQDNCLLRSVDNQVYHLDLKQPSEIDVEAMNQMLTQVFENIVLLGNHHADPEMVEFIDKSLAKKNLEPFDKIFLRHILIKYGKYEREYKRVDFHTDWLPEKTYSYRGPGDRGLVIKPMRALRVKLDEQIVRGYYINSGGTVYVEDVDRDVAYATGEEYGYNVSAFKLFVQKLFTQSTQYILVKEKERLTTLAYDGPILAELSGTPFKVVPQYADAGSTRSRGISRGGSDAKDGTSRVSKPAYAQTFVNGQLKRMKIPIKPLYHEYNWIPMMLGILRNKGISIAHRDVLGYLKNQPFFPHVYEQLTPKERKEVDRNL